MKLRALLWAGAVALVAAAHLPTRFIVTFEIFGPAVNSPKHGWLGPTPRGTSCVVDAGKVNSWTCEDVSLFEEHRYGCQLWLKTFGYV
jgi:hypothetical protein